MIALKKLRFSIINGFSNTKKAMKKFTIFKFPKQEDYSVEYKNTELLQMASVKDSDIIGLAYKATELVLDNIDEPDEWPFIKYRNFTDDVNVFRRKLTEKRFSTNAILDNKVVC